MSTEFVILKEQWAKYAGGTSKPMNILITGGTGFIGRALLPHLSQHKLTVLSRNPMKAYQRIGHHIKVIDKLDRLKNLDAFDAVINLAGEPIINKRWSSKQKKRICHSRWDITQQLAEKWQASTAPPHTVISGSAVGYYGDQQDTIIDETHAVTDNGFAHQVCQKWEDIALSMSHPNTTRVCLLRTGIVLGKQGGALAKMLPIYQLGLGGPISNGRQYFPWIHINDMVKGIVFLLTHQHAQGVFNFTAPNPVTNREFSQTLAQLLHRPHWLFTPAWALKVSLGESADLLLDSQRIKPTRLLEAGFHFTYPQLECALKAALNLR